MSIHHLILPLALALPVITRAADRPATPQEPDHLVPVNPYPGDWRARYTSQLQSHFKLDSFFFAQMVVRPSFSGEFVVRLHGARDDNDFDTASTLFLTYSAAKQSIWYSMPENNDEQKKKGVSIAATTVEFPKPLATRIQKLWQRMLLQTRYPQEYSGGLDGTTYEFGIWSVYGETWSPLERKSPLLFIELGDSLIIYCLTPPAERSAAAKNIEDKAAQLEKYLDKHTSK